MCQAILFKFEIFRSTSNCFSASNPRKFAELAIQKIFAATAKSSRDYSQNDANLGIHVDTRKQVQSIWMEDNVVCNLRALPIEVDESFHRGRSRRVKRFRKRLALGLIFDAF